MFEICFSPRAHLQFLLPQVTFTVDIVPCKTGPIPINSLTLASLRFSKIPIDKYDTLTSFI